MSDQTHHYGDDCQPPHAVMSEDGVPLTSPFAELRAENERLLTALLDLDSIVRDTELDRDAFTAREMRQRVISRIAQATAPDERPTP